jgi:hypothetical protein
MRRKTPNAISWLVVLDEDWLVENLIASKVMHALWAATGMA